MCEAQYSHFQTQQLSVSQQGGFLLQDLRDENFDPQTKFQTARNPIEMTGFH